ncbi:ATP-dependent zinc metalloprotease FtsH [Corynebacterium uterequi]|uniref:ATP-dependent zinc metalloprotease FtsH n=1 Tax=Corynebacterium uterequi TaxID=1072256 RepID=A0A0G3HIW1_9CORY|nr:ATP-dependent zinc metalloprotease FtsH [Corynebacterium uterequi]AKK11878.1 ATP-dependent metalloprotease FtsH [Corynebacterium uterequi]
MKNKRILQLGVLAAIMLVSLFVISSLTDPTRGFQRVETSVALEQLERNNVDKAQIDDREQQLRLELREPITVDKREGVEEIITQYPARATPQVFDAVAASDASTFATNVTKDSFLLSMVSFLLPMLVLFGLLFFLMSRMQSGAGGMFGIGGNKAKQLTKDMPTNTFADVAGADEAVDELQEVVDFLQDGSRYEKLGAKIPRGVLLYGPPGTGKTLLARAVAGEAGVAFYTISGSDFVEMFVGVGASRVRDLFKQARENSPCIIFIDEIDAVGRQRGSGMGGGHDEREQTLNQLLVEMDGFGDREGVILIAATNRPDILDPALLRPGRFDRQIPVTNPDLKGRQEILKIHAAGKPMGPDADLDALAKRTAGMSGADLANVVNEAALLTARIGGNIITADALEEATDRVIGGPRRSSKIISEDEKRVTAYHEGGHTLAAWALKDIERVYKVTILARGRTGGHAMTAQEDDKGMYNLSELYARLVFAMGGRSAEEVVFGMPTTGASADIEQATKIARAMVTEYGMAPSIGAVKYGREDGDPFAMTGGGGSLDYSPEIAHRIDEQVAYLLDSAHRRAYDILSRYRDHLDALASKLLEKETLRRPDLEALFDDIDPEPVGDIFPTEPTRFPRQLGREPVKTPVELAIERGEEPPKRFSLLEASRAARAKRQEEKAAAEANQALSRGRHHRPDEGSAGQATENLQIPRYEGTPPPANWTVPGWPPVKRDDATSSANPYAQPTQPEAQPGAQPAEPPSQPPVHTPTQAPAQPPSEPTSREHPGMKNYTVGDETLVGFQLPDHEKPDHAESPAPSQDETTEMPRTGMPEFTAGEEDRHGRH